MKIRSDFVTNSSSYSTSEIMIDNPVLLEILQKYKDIGLFGNQHPIIGIGCFDTEGSSYPLDSEGIRESIGAPAFYFFESTGGDGDIRSGAFAYGSPTTITEVLDAIISVLNEVDNNGYFDSRICVQLINELNEEKEEINRNFIQIYWHNDLAWDDGEQIYEYEYDPVDGERFFGSPPNEDDSFEDDSSDEE